MTDPVISDGRRLRLPFNGYVVGGILLGLSVVVGVLGVVIIVKSLIGDFGDYERVDVPSGGEVTVDEPGTYRIFYEGDVCDESGETSSCDSFSGGAEPELVPADGGEPLSLEPDSGFSYEFSGREGVEAWRVRIPDAGDYELDLSQPPPDVSSLAVGKTPSVDKTGLLLAVAAAPTLGLLGIVTIIVTIVRRSRARRSAQPPTPPPSAWGTGRAAPTWQPPPSPQHLPGAPPPP